MDEQIGKGAAAHMELDEVISKPMQDEEDRELAEALRNYRPGTDAEKKLLRKIDMRLMPILWIMYILNYVDRTNIVSSMYRFQGSLANMHQGNAKIAGMMTDLKLTDERYSLALSIFFIGYLIMEVPSNMILSRSRPSIFLPGIMLVWGALSAGMGGIPNYGSLLAFRFILGCIESGFFPGVLFVLSCWYKPHEIGKRFAIFYSAAVLSGAFGGLLAGGITDGLDGAHGIAAWRWLFIIEGSATVGVSIIASFIILDFPSTSKALSLPERQLATVRLLASGVEGNSKASMRLTHWQAFKAAVCDYRTFMFMLLFVLDVGAGTISYFIPQITKTLGYSTVKAQYMTIPVYMVAAVVLNITAFSADRFNERRWHVTAALSMGFVAALVCAVVDNAKVRYAMLCFVAAGIWTALPLILAWVTSVINLPAEKRAISIAMINAVGNLSSVYGAQLWPSKTAPGYKLGWGVTAGFLGGGAIIAALIPVIMKIFKVKITKAERELGQRKEAAGMAADESEVRAFTGVA